MDFAELVRRRIEELGLNVNQAEKIHGFPTGYIRGVLRQDGKKATPSVEKVEAISRALGLEFYVGEPRDKGFMETAEAYESLATERGWITLHPKQVSTLATPPPLERIRYPDRWFAERNLSTDTTALVYVDDAGMQPAIPEGSTVVVDTSETEIPDRPTLFATAFGPLIRVRRVERHDGLVISRPDNPRHLVDTYSKAHGDLFTVLGRVRAVVSEFN